MREKREEREEREKRKRSPLHLATTQSGTTLWSGRIVAWALCHSCEFPCQQMVLRIFHGPGYLCSKDRVVCVWLWHFLANVYVCVCVCVCVCVFVCVCYIMILYIYYIYYIYCTYIANEVPQFKWKPAKSENTKMKKSSLRFFYHPFWVSPMIF